MAYSFIDIARTAQTDLRGGGQWPSELGPNKFQERPSGVSRMQENLTAAGAPLPDRAGGVYSAPRGPLVGGEEAGCPLPKNPASLSAIWASGLDPDQK